MTYVLLLLLLALFILHIRLAKKVGNIQIDLSEDLKSEIITLIAEFNHSAEKNITLIESQVEEAKIISKEMIHQLGYMKKLKENLEKEIKETEARLKETLDKSQKILIQMPKQEPTLSLNQPTLMAKTYTQVQEQTTPPIKHQEKVEKQEEKEKKENTKPLVEESKIEEKKVEKEGVIPQEEKKSMKELVQNLYQKNFSAHDIALELGITRGEVDFILKLLK